MDDELDKRLMRVATLGYMRDPSGPLRDLRPTHFDAALAIERMGGDADLSAAAVARQLIRKGRVSIGEVRGAVGERAFSLAGESPLCVPMGKSTWLSHQPGQVQMVAFAEVYALVAERDRLLRRYGDPLSDSMHRPEIQRFQTDYQILRIDFAFAKGFLSDFKERHGGASVELYEEMLLVMDAMTSRLKILAGRFEAEV